MCAARTTFDRQRKIVAVVPAPAVDVEHDAAAKLLDRRPRDEESKPGPLAAPFVVKNGSPARASVRGDMPVPRSVTRPASGSSCTANSSATASSRSDACSAF